MTEADRVARPMPCPRCLGRGRLCVVACRYCAFLARVSGLPVPWRLRGETAERFACGHFLNSTALVGEATCPGCDGIGEVLVSRTAAEWERRDRRAARTEKLERSLLALALVDTGPLWGQTRGEWRRMIASLTPRCERRSVHTGQGCRKRVVLGRLRCELHGGRSTGPKTAAGRDRIRESNRRRAAEAKVEKAVISPPSRSLMPDGHGNLA